MEWKCVKQNKPEEDKEYLVYDGDIFVATFETGETNMWFKNSTILVHDVTHFMELPNRPERLSPEDHIEDNLEMISDSPNHDYI